MNLYTVFRKVLREIILLFLYFQKAFDSVWYNGLLYKLLDNKIGGKFYHFIVDTFSR